MSTTLTARLPPVQDSASRKQPSISAERPSAAVSPGPWRHEFKYLVPRYLRAALLTDLRLLTSPDDHGGTDGTYEVRTLYFDSIDRSCFFDKVDGVCGRHKLRLRAYPDPSGRVDVVKFEVKHRDGERVRKDIAIVNRTEYQTLEPALLRPSAWCADWLRERPGLAPFFRLKILHAHAPVLCMRYRRLAMRTRCGDARVTIDDQLAAGAGRDVFQPVRHPPHLLRPGESVLEFKVAERLPFWAHHLIRKYRLRTQPVSKYAIAAAARWPGFAALMS